MDIVIISPGKNNEPFIQQGLEYYFKKIRNYHPIRLDHFIIKATTDLQHNKQAEAEQILKRLQPNDFIILLDERGKMYDNLKWAKLWQQVMNQSFKRIVFIIGGAYGVDKAVQQKAQATLSLSNLIFPHQLVRLIIAEQIYRTIAIIHHLPYHHQ